MKKNFANILEQRIYLFYFFVTFILVFFIVFIEWQMIKYGIRMTENQKINYLFENYKNQAEKIYNERLNNLNLISEYLKNDKEFSKEDIISVLKVLGKQDAIRNMYFIDKNKDIIFGETWDLIDKYKGLLFLNAKGNGNGYIITFYGNKSYILIYKSIIDKNMKFVGFILQVEPFAPKLPYVAESRYAIYPYPFKEINIPKDIRSYYNKIINICRNMRKNETEKIVRFSYSQAFGIYRNRDANGNTISVFLVIYQRSINMFAQQSLWLFVLILMAVTFIMIAIFGNWFKKAIIHPVRILSETMKKNSESPTELKKINLNYGGVLGEMINSFNQMENSLEKYSRYLLEYKIATENIENGIFWLNEDFKVLMCNKSFLKILGENNSIMGKSFTDYIKLNDLQINRIRKGSLTLNNYEYKIDKEIKHLNINFRLVAENKRNIIIGSITDITEITREKTAREKLELELIKSNKLAEIGRRVEGIVHNMNSPLNSIIGYAQLLLKETGKNEDLEKILKSGKLIAHYIKSLQQKIKNDHISVYRPLDINELLQNELELFKNNLFFKHHVKTIVKLKKDLPQINAVYGDVSMCITNIINNALEAMENSEEKTLKIETDITKENMIKITISDTGCGISEEDLQNIFEAYYTTKRYPKGSGYGLGLAISKYIIEKYKGKISVQSKKGKGSVFTLYFPVNG